MKKTLISISIVIGILTAAGCSSSIAKNVNVDPVSGAPVPADPSGKNPGYPDGVEGTKKAFASFEQAKTLLISGQTEQALTMFSEIRNSLPDGQQPSADYYSALALVSLKEFDKASQATSIGALRGAMDPLIALVESEKGNNIGKSMLLSCRSLIQSSAPAAQKEDRDDNKISDRSAALFGIATEYPDSGLADKLLIVAHEESPDSILLTFGVLSKLSENYESESWIRIYNELLNKKISKSLRTQLKEYKRN